MRSPKSHRAHGGEGNGTCGNAVARSYPSATVSDHQLCPGTARELSQHGQGRSSKVPATPRPSCAAALAQTRGLRVGAVPMPGHGAPLGVLQGSVSSVAMPHCWFLSRRANSQVLLLQHPHFQRAHPTAEEPGALGGGASLFAKQQKKRKKKRCASSPCPPRGAMSQDTRGEQS